jgi:ABC-type multidrug transport system fused ATPase/permease subunit
MWGLSEGKRVRIIAYILCFTLAQLINMTQPWIMGVFIDMVQQDGVSYETLPRLLGTLSWIIWTTLGFWIFHGVGRYIERTHAFYVRAQYHRSLMNGILSQGLSWHAERESGETIDKINKGSDGLMAFSENLFQVVTVIVRIIGTFFVLLFYGFPIAAMLLFGAVLTFTVIFLFDKKLVVQYGQLHGMENRIQAKVFDIISNITTAIILRIQKPLLKDIAATVQKPRDLHAQNVVLNESKWVTADVLINFVSVIPIAYYLIVHASHGETVAVGSITALWMYLRQVTDVFYTFCNEYESILVRRARVKNSETLEMAFERSVQRKSTPQWKEVLFGDISFSYDGSRIPAIKGAQLHVKKGERIALIGASGSGKTTLLKVLHGMYDHSSALISYDGKKAIRTPLAQVNLRTMLVPQEPEVFAASIRENITLGIDFSEKEVKTALNLAQFSNVVAQLPKGLDSLINEKGVNLSGGQKQRLALSRALLFAEGKDIILLDESTSSVDPETEVKIYEQLFTHFRDHTIIASIHKMNLLKYFDRICIFAGGKVEDEGTFDDLLLRNEHFRKSWEQYRTTVK